MATLNQKPITQTLAPARPSALGAMAKRLNVEPEKLMKTLQDTCFKNATPEQMLALVVVSNEYGLNPFLREIYAFPAKDGGIVPVVSVDGWIKMINRQVDLDGLDFEYVYEDDDPRKMPISTTCILFVKNRSRPIRVTEFYEECKRNTDPWNKMPRRMLRHKSLMQTGRVAFGFSGVHDEDEAIDIVTSVVQEPRQLPQRGYKAPESELKAAADEVPMEFNQPQESEAQPEAKPATARQEFQKLMTENQIDFSTVQKWGVSSGNIPNADTFASVDEIPEETLKRLLRAKTGLINNLKTAKGAA